MRGVAQVAELVDALVSGTSGEIRGGSSPLLGTKLQERYEGRRLCELPAFFVQVRFGSTDSSPSRLFD